MTSRKNFTNGKHKRILLQVFTFTLVLVIIGALYIPCSLSDFYDQSHIQFIHQSIERIPMEDRADLKRVLEKGIFRSQFGYTLFGEKPLSIDGYLEERAIHASYKRRNNPKMKKDAIERNHKLQKGWKIWEKYAHFFPSENYILRKQPDSVMDGAVTIYLMNKKAFYQVIEKYRQDFEKVLGKDFCVEEIINSFEKGEGIFFDKIVEHDGLFGTLLGYGRDNAWDFYRKTEIAKRLTTQEEISSEK